MDRRNLRLGGLTTAALALLALLPGLGGWSRLTYHEAIVAQGAREMLSSGDWVVPTIGGRPWLEKPPLAHWLVAGCGRVAGRVDETIARVPSALSAVVVALCIVRVAGRVQGPRTGWLAGAVAATSAWLVGRGRLADADMLLAALVSVTLTLFDALRGANPARRTRWLFFVFLGATALAKGIGFGAGLSLAVIAATLIASRDATTARRLLWFPGWAIAVCVALAWPLSVIGRHPEALALWWTHGPGRLVPAADVGFATASWPSFVGSYLAFTLPWTPLVLLAVIREGFSLSRRPGHDPFLLCWAAVPVMLVSVSSTRNAHYLLSSLPPWSIAAALTLERAAGRLSNRGWSTDRLRGSAAVLLGGLALAWGLGFACLGPSLDQRGKGREWSFYERCSRALSSDARVYLLYDAPDRPDRWDREPYKTPFGPVPPDLAARLFYLARQVVVAYGIGDLSRELDVAVPSRIAIIARPRDLPALKTLGAVEILGHGPAARIDRQFSFARLHYGDSESDLALARARPFD